MQPSPTPTPQERADEFDVAARIAYERHDYVFAQELANHAYLLRMQAQQESKTLNLWSATQ